MFWITTKATPEPFLWELATVGTMIPTLIGWSATGKVNKMNFFLDLIGNKNGQITKL